LESITVEEATIGIGDEIIGTGMARGAAARGKRIAFGDGRRIIWGPFAAEAFRHNPNIAHRPDEPGVEWVRYHKGHRIYNSQDVARRRWIWNYDFKAPVGVLQTSHGKVRLNDVETIAVNCYRDAAAVVASVDLAIVPEGGLHHAAAAVGTLAIVIHGGFTPPQVLGYDAHINLTGGATEACGSLDRCEHCRAALDRIEVADVYAIAAAALHKKNPTTSAGASRLHGFHSASERQILP
jgi:hypothetical protein